MRDRLIFAGQLLFTLLVAAFLIVPAALSMLAGVTANYFRGISSGFTLQWIVQVWDLYADTIGRSFLIAGATLVVTLLIGTPAAYALHVRGGRMARAIEEIVTLPLAIPGLAIALALLLTYNGFSDFRRSWLFILAGHVVFTLPFMTRSVMAIFSAIDTAAFVAFRTYKFEKCVAESVSPDGSRRVMCLEWNWLDTCFRFVVTRNVDRPVTCRHLPGVGLNGGRDGERRLSWSADSQLMCLSINDTPLCVYDFSKGELSSPSASWSSSKSREEAEAEANADFAKKVKAMFTEHGQPSK